MILLRTRCLAKARFWALAFFGLSSWISGHVQSLEGLSVAQAQALLDARRLGDESIQRLRIRVTDLEVNPHPNEDDPAAIAHGDVYRGETYVGFQQIEFVGTTPESSSIRPFELIAFMRAEAIEAADSRRVKEQLNVFLDTAFNVSLGPERFRRFLPERLREFGTNREWYSTWGLLAPAQLERLSDVELLELVTTALDMALVLPLYSNEHPKNLFRLWETLDSAADSTSPDSPLLLARIMRDQLDVVRKDLGSLDSAHLKRDIPFLKQSLVGSLVKKLNSDTDHNRADVPQVHGLPISAELYDVEFGNFILRFHWFGEQMKIVDIVTD